MKKILQSVWSYVALGVVVVGVVAVLLATRSNPATMRLDQFRTRIAHHQVRTATALTHSQKFVGKLRDGRDYEVGYPTSQYGTTLTHELITAGVRVDSDNQSDSGLESFLYNFLPTLLVIGVFLWFVMQLQGGGRGQRFGRAKARKAKLKSSVTFADVAGADEAVTELSEIRDFLADPERFRRLGATIPKGVLLIGPPGTGKTLLARAVAGEAGVPFLTISGSDFVEMFVGVGAARVRDLFRQAREMAPAIVFVDEIDAVGRHRGTGVGGGHDGEQTLNQLLVELDGFDGRGDVILMAATNRPDILDPALLRPGRFDRHVHVDAPDLHGREAILDVHSRNKPLASVSLPVVARRTAGFTGADLANVVNEAALLAGRRSSHEITMPDMSEAIDRVMAGPERRSIVMSQREKRVTAYHEAGHALVGLLLPDADPVHRVSIVARGRALGWTQNLPTEDRYTLTRSELRARLAILMGGLSAEELVFDERTTGATDDIEKATRLARSMVTEFGMSEKLGPRRFAGADEEPFLGREMGHVAGASDETAALVDSEITRFLDEAHQCARQLLTERRATLQPVLAERLIETETLDEDELAAVLAHTTEGAA